MAYGDAFTFEGLELIERRFLSRADEGAYIVLKDRTHREQEEALGRLDLTAAQVAPYVDDPDLGGAFDDDEPSDPYDDEYDPDDDEPPEPRPVRVPDTLSPQEIMQAALRWLRDTAIRNTVGEAQCRFRVRLFAVKGHKVVDSGHFVCRNDDEQVPDAEDAAPPLRIPTPTFDEAARSGSVKGLKALGDYYAQWGGIVLGSVGQLQGVNNAMLAKLHKQLEESRGQVDQLVASILEFRVKEIEVQENRLADERDGDARTTLAREALGQLGAAANTFLAGRGMTPDMLEVVTQLGGSPELMAALKDPAVRALMQDHDNLKGLAEMLRQAGSQAQAAQQQPTPTPTESAA